MATEVSSGIIYSPEERNHDVCNTSGESNESNITNSSVSGEDSDSRASPDLHQVPPLSPEKQEDLGPDHEYEKPPYSYIALISMALLKSADGKLLLGDIYQYLSDKFPYYKYSADKAWRNSIRHNLSINECFIKAGRADNGKGNYWAIHSACKEDFSKGDYRRRHARRRARKNNINVSQLPLNYRYNLGYVPMTPVAASAGSMGMTPYAMTSHYHPYAYQMSYQNTTSTPDRQQGGPISTPSPTGQTFSPPMTSFSPLGGAYSQPTAAAATLSASCAYPSYLGMPNSSDYLLPGSSVGSTPSTSPSLLGSQAQLQGLSLRDMPALRDALSGLI